MIEEIDQLFTSDLQKKRIILPRYVMSCEFYDHFNPDPFH